MKVLQDNEIFICNEFEDLFDLEYGKVTYFSKYVLENHFEVFAVRIEARNPIDEIQVAQAISVGVFNLRKHAVYVKTALQVCP
jgi:hypothetical protein